MLHFIYRDTFIDDDIFTENLRHELFDAHTVGDLGHALRGSNRDVRENIINFFIAAIAHGILFHFRAKITLIFAEDFRDKLFDADITAALERALNDEDSNVRRSIVELFTAAIAQGELGYFYGILTAKVLQRGFGTRYLRSRSSLHLNMH